MSILTSLIPLPYRIAGIAVILVAVLVTGRVMFDRAVTKKADAVIAAYVAKRVKDDAELQAIDTSTNARIQIQYVDRVQTIVKQLPGTITTITKIVHDNEVLSPEWICVHNAAATGGDVSKCAN